MNLPDLFKRNNKSGILKNPGDKFEAKITSTGKQVIKISQNNGDVKYSAVRYPDRLVETKSTKL